jgi:hypothetical protein
MRPATNAFLTAVCYSAFTVASALPQFGGGYFGPPGSSGSGTSGSGSSGSSGSGSSGSGSGGIFGGQSPGGFFLGNNDPTLFFNGDDDYNQGIQQGLIRPQDPNFYQIDYERAAIIRLAHGVLASFVFVFVFPVGAILVRIIPGRLCVILHGLMQLLGYVLFIAAAGLGLYVVVQVRYQGFNLVRLAAPVSVLD